MKSIRQKLVFFFQTKKCKLKRDTSNKKYLEKKTVVAFEYNLEAIDNLGESTM